MSDLEVPRRQALLVGAEAIARFLGIRERKVYALADRKELPVFRLGGRLAARPEALQEHFARLEAEVLRDAGAA